MILNVIIGWCDQCVWYFRETEQRHASLGFLL